VRTLLTHQHRHPLSCRSVMPLPWRSSPGATTPASTTHSSSTSRVPVAAPPPSSASPPASLLGAPPPGPSGGGGRRGRRGRGGEGRGTPTQDPTPPPSHSSSQRCALADRLPPVVRAYLHVALPRSGRGPRPPHKPAAKVTSAASYAPTWTPPPPPSSSWPGVVVGSGCPGAVLQHCGADATRRHRVDCRLGCLLPHYSRCGYPFFCPTSSPLLSFLHHGR
jgi:hypothetical protein